MLVEVAGGLVSGSLALIADAGHMLTDFAALAIAWPPSASPAAPPTPGAPTASTASRCIAAFVNGLALFLVAIWIVIEAARRLNAPAPVEGGIMLAVAAAGLVVNVLAFRVLSRGDRDNLNLRAALLHVAGDLLGSPAPSSRRSSSSGPAGPPSTRSSRSWSRSSSCAPPGWWCATAATSCSRPRPRASTPPPSPADLAAAVPEVTAVRHLHAWSITENRPMVTLEAVVPPTADPDATRRGSRPASPKPSASTTPPSRSARRPQTRGCPRRLRVYLDALPHPEAPAMPIKIPAALPAHDVLRREGVMVMSEETALRQDIRPLQIGLLNLMPKKVQTETQFARVIAATPLQIELTLIRMSDHESRNTSAAHLEAFYQPFRQARERRFDGLIITGAPIEHLDFEAVGYWSELREIFDWTQTNVHSTMGVCWGGMAMLHHFHGVPKHMLPAKAFGCFRHHAAAAVGAAPPGLLRQLRGAGQPLDRGARRGRRSSTPSSRC